jgi:hypothetical protein
MAMTIQASRSQQESRSALADRISATAQISAGAKAPLHLRDSA